MFSQTSRPRSRIWGTSVRKHCFFVLWLFSLFFVFLWYLLVFQWVWVFCVGFYLFFNGFLWFYNGLEQLLIKFMGFPYGFALFWMVPWGFSLFVCSRNGSCIKIKGKLIENQSQPTAGPLRSFLPGLSLLCLSLLRGPFSGTSPESLLVV